MRQNFEMVIGASYGNGIAVETLNSLDDYIAVVQNPPWESVEKQLIKKPKNIIEPKSMEQDILERVAEIKLGKGTIVGLGGGVAVDSAKFFSWKWDLPLIQVPTIISTDAFLSKEIGVRNESRVRYIGTSNPEKLIIDFDLIRSAPPQLNYAGVSDVASICTALGDWKIANEKFGDKIDSNIFNRSKYTVEQMFKDAKEINSLSDKGIKALVEYLREECIICGEWGSARPEEGSEHFLAYTIENVNPGRYLHGALVAMNILVVLRLQGSYAVFDYEVVRNFFDELGLNYSPKSLDISREVYKTALDNVQNYVKNEKLDNGLWHLNNPFENLSKDEVLDWVFTF
ncbi:MAG: iron-containing alcohol dehydrogenase family protein [archaeon]|nr:iron-containing alcohol dehydrogenase family protein [archaeon]